MSDDAALAGFIDKWRARWPEWQVARVFLPAAQRDVAAAWMALLQELTDAAWGGSDPTPGLAKLAWWQEELRGWGRGARRHPLGLVLQRMQAPWPGLAATLLDLQRTRATPASAEAAFAGLASFAHAVAQCESALFAAGGATGIGEVVSIQRALLGARVLDDPDAATPWQVGDAATAGPRATDAMDAAAAGQPAAMRRSAWIGALLAATPPAGPAARRIQLALVEARLRHVRVDAVVPRPLPPTQALWTAWRAARKTTPA